MGWRDVTPPYIDILQFDEVPKLIPWRPTIVVEHVLRSTRGENSVQASNGPHSHEQLLAKDIDQSEVVLSLVEGSVDQDVCVQSFPAPWAPNLPENIAP